MDLKAGGWRLDSGREVVAAALVTIAQVLPCEGLRVRGGTGRQAGVWCCGFGVLILKCDFKQGLVINAQNCLHCKTCDIKDPTQNIDWTVPEVP